MMAAPGSSHGWIVVVIIIIIILCGVGGFVCYKKKKELLQMKAVFGSDAKNNVEFKNMG